MKGVLILLGLTLPAPALSEALVAAQTLRSGTILSAADLRLDPEAQGSLSDPSAVLGMELRVMVSQGRPIEPSHLIAPRVIARNQLVTLAFERGSLRIEAEGRALSAGSIGEVIRVMNNSSRTTVSGRITPDGTVLVSPN